jgi:hypothetical protein
MNTLEARATALNFGVTGDELLLIDKIVHRFAGICKEHGKQLAIVETMMDITLSHTQNNKLNLFALLLTNDNDFAADVIGIIKNMDRSTGKLTNGFVPRNIVQ